MNLPDNGGFGGRIKNYSLLAKPPGVYRPLAYIEDKYRKLIIYSLFSNALDLFPRIKIYNNII